MTVYNIHIVVGNLKAISNNSHRLAAIFVIMLNLIRFNGVVVDEAVSEIHMLIEGRRWTRTREGRAWSGVKLRWNAC